MTSSSRSLRLEPLGSISAKTRSLSICPTAVIALEVGRAEEGGEWAVLERRLESPSDAVPSALPIPSDAELTDVWCTDPRARDLVVGATEIGETSSTKGRAVIVSRVSSSGAATIWTGEAVTLTLVERELFVASADKVTVVDLTSGDEMTIPDLGGARVLAAGNIGGRLAALAEPSGAGGPRVMLVDVDSPGQVRVLRPPTIRGEPYDATWLDERQLLVSTSEHLGVIDTVTNEDRILARVESDVARTLALFAPVAVSDAAALPVAETVGSSASGGESTARPSGSAWVVGAIVFTLAIALTVLGRRWARHQRGSLRD